MADQATLELLKEIARNTGGNDTLWVACIAGGSAVLGAAVSALIAYFASKQSADVQLRTAEIQANLERKKLTASIVSTERLRWLQDLRGKVAEFYSNIEMQIMHIARAVDPNVEPISREAMDAISKDAGVKGNIILLVLNPEVTEQQELFRSINDALHFTNTAMEQARLNSASPNRNELAAIKNRSFNALHKIGRKAWERVQELE